MNSKYERQRQPERERERKREKEGDRGMKWEETVRESSVRKRGEETLNIK